MKIVTHINQQELENWKEDYEPDESIRVEIYDDLTKEVTLDELNEILKEVKNKKVLGCSGIMYEEWKNSGEQMKTLLIILINIY